MGRDENKSLWREMKRAKRSTVFVGVFAVAAVILLIVSFFYGRRLGRAESGKLLPQKTEITQDVLHQQLEGIGELNTVRYYYTNMGRYENTLQFNGQNVPFTKKSFIISYDGVIKAGVVLSEITFEVSDKTITVHIPEAQILSHDVDMDSVTVFDEKDSIFNGLSTEDVMNFQKEQQKAMEERAVAGGILSEAKENTKDCLTTIYQVLLKDDGYEEGYVLEFAE